MQRGDQEMSDDDNVVVLGMPTKLDIPPDRVLTSAVGNMQTVMVIGYDKDGKFVPGPMWEAYHEAMGDGDDNGEDE